MGHLLTSVREAEERLAAVARALSSAYDEEISEAKTAQVAARASLGRALAMDELAQALGRVELSQRVREVIASLEASAQDARSRLEELAQVEERLHAQLATSSPPLLQEPAPPTESGPEIRLPSTPLPTAPEAKEPTPTLRSEPQEPAASLPVEAAVEVEIPRAIEGAPAPVQVPSQAAALDATVEETVEVDVVPAEVATESTSKVAVEPSERAAAAEPTPPSLSDEARTRVAQLANRVEEIARGATRWPEPVLEAAIQEHVALARLLALRFGEPPGAARGALASALEKLAAIAKEHAVERLIGLNESDAADWNRLASASRAKRLAFVEARRAKK